MEKNRTKTYSLSVLIILVIFCNFRINAQKGPCTDNSKYGCCSGTAWNASLNRCVECQPGFVGFQCTFACLYPYYGQGCLNVCKCSEYECKPSTGCSEMKIENISNMISSDTSSIPTNFSNNFSEVLNDNVCSTCISFPTYGIILIALCLVGLLILTGFVSFIFTKLYYTKIWEKRITNEYQEMQRRQLSENSYERIDVANVFTGISNVNITYERLNKLYSINLNQEGSNAVPEISLPNNPVYDDCINMDSGSSA